MNRLFARSVHPKMSTNILDHVRTLAVLLEAKFSNDGWRRAATAPTRATGGVFFFFPRSATIAENPKKRPNYRVVSPTWTTQPLHKKFFIDSEEPIDPKKHKLSKEDDPGFTTDGHRPRSPPTALTRGCYIGQTNNTKLTLGKVLSGKDVIILLTFPMFAFALVNIKVDLINFAFSRDWKPGELHHSAIRNLQFGL